MKPSERINKIAFGLVPPDADGTKTYETSVACRAIIKYLDVLNELTKTKEE
jgi:hypothetical protein